jgi:hypothetical protein
MATAIFGLILDGRNTPGFRSFGSTLSAQLGAMLTRVPQSGDIDWETVNGNSLGTVVGSEVYRFNDALQATHPIFIKIGYGFGSSGNAVHLSATIGKSADGAGNIGGVLMSIVKVCNHADGAATPTNSYISYGSSWFALSLGTLINSCGGVFVIERSLTSNGTPNGNTLLVGFQERNTSTPEFRYIDYANATSEAIVGGIVAIPMPLSTDRSIANGTTCPVFPAACISPSGVFWRPRVILGTARQNAGLGEVIQGLLDGNSYLSLGAGSQKSDQRNGAFATTLIRWN